MSTIIIPHPENIPKLSPPKTIFHDVLFEPAIPYEKTGDIVVVAVELESKVIEGASPYYAVLTWNIRKTKAGAVCRDSNNCVIAKYSSLSWSSALELFAYIVENPKYNLKSLYILPEETNQSSFKECIERFRKDFPKIFDPLNYHSNFNTRYQFESELFTRTPDW